MSVLTRVGIWPLRDRPADAAIAVAVAAVVVVGTLLGVSGTRDSGHLDALGWLLIVVASAALYVRRRYPVAVAVFTLVVCLVYYPLITVDGPLLLTFVVALYTVAAEGNLTAAVVLGVALMLVFSYDKTVSPYPQHVDDIALFMLTGWLVAVIAVGAVKNSRVAYLREVEQRAAAAERSKEEEARRRVTEERLRIARELHDVLGHNVSLINVQAGAAMHRFKQDPGQAEQALGAIRQTSGDALRELRSTLGVLRQVDEDAPTTPAPSMARLDELVEGAKAAGLAVWVETEGEPRHLPAEVDLAAYRIVQEALTNVTRHTGAPTALVRIHWRHDEVCVQVDNRGNDVDGVDAGGEPSTSLGNGIRGMEERARALGGELTAGGLPGGGFRVRARLPLGGGS